MKITSNQEAREAAELFRIQHRLGLQPLGDMVALIEQATGIDVAVMDVDDHHEHGLTMRDPERDVMFLGVAKTPHPMRQRSTLAHELAHILFDDWAEYDAGNWDRRSYGEMRADSFAGHLLVPRQGIREFLGNRSVELPVDLSDVVQWFLVSPQMALIAMEEAGYLDAADKKGLWHYSTPQLAVQYGWIDQYQALQSQSHQHRAPQRLLARAISGYREGVLSAQAIATLRGTDVVKAEHDLREAGIVQKEPDGTLDDAITVPPFDFDLTDLDDGSE